MHISTELNSGELGGLLGRYASLLENVEIVKARTLFPINPVWTAILEDKCPYCAHKLYFPFTRHGQEEKGVVRCKSKKCPSDKKFVVPIKKYREIKGKIKFEQNLKSFNKI